MSDSPMQLTLPPLGAGTPAWSRNIFDQKLTLAPFTTSLLDWSLMSWDLQVRRLDIGSISDDALRPACGALGRQMLLSPRLDPQASAPAFANALGPDAWDTLYGLLRMAGPTLAWSDVPGTQRNIVTGGPVSRGKVDGGGMFVPTAADGVIAGFGLPSPAIKIGKRFSFVSAPDIHLYLYVDKDAYANDMKYFASGGGIQFGGKTSDGTPLKLRLGVGRDTAGGGAGFIRLQIGPDYVSGAP